MADQQDQEQRRPDGRFAAGNTVRTQHGFRSDRVRKRNRQKFLAESERELRDDLPGPIPARLFRITATALADLDSFEDYVNKHGGPVKANGATLGLWTAYEGQKRLVIDLLERCGVAPARGRAARQAPAKARAQKAEKAVAAEAYFNETYGRPQKETD